MRFSELHYDNIGVDVGEAIEIEGPAGTDLTGWSIVLYDGNGGAPYNTTDARAGTTIPATCDARGVVVVNYPSNGIQNGSPDGMALVDASGTVVEFLSYEGTFTAVGGPADGMLSTDIIAAGGLDVSHRRVAAARRHRARGRSRHPRSAPAIPRVAARRRATPSLQRATPR